MRNPFWTNFSMLLKYDNKLTHTHTHTHVHKYTQQVAQEVCKIIVSCGATWSSIKLNK